MERNKTLIWKIISLAVVWRLALFGLSALADRWLEYRPSFPYAFERLAKMELPRWLYSWANFDGVHYLTIAESGYVGTASIQAFFPLFPMIVRFLGQSVVGGVVLNFLLTILVLWLFFELARKEYSKNVSLWAGAFLIAFPTSFFLGALYTEALFLALILGSFLVARNKQWLWAGLLGALASATRVVGIAILPALLVELWLQKKPASLQSFVRTNWREISLVSLSALGLAGYMGSLWVLFADPLYFFHVQETFGAGRQTHLILLPQVLWRYVKILWTARPFDWKYFSYAQDLILSLGVLTSLIGFFRKIRPSYLVFSLLTFLLPPLTGTLNSMPRYVLICFPIFFLLASETEKKPVLRAFLLTASVFLLIINTVLFIQGYWVA